MNDKKEGFTLIELLAVIVILGIIAVIAVPVLINYIKKAEEQTFLESARNVVKAVQLKYIEDPVMGTKQYSIKNGKIDPKIDMSGSIKGNGYIQLDSYNNIRIVLTEGNLCVKKEYADIDPLLYYTACDTNVEETENLDTSGASVPLLDTSMVPIHREGNHWIKADKNNVIRQYQWYDYNASMWANAAVIKSDKKAKYQAMAVGAKIDEKDVIGYFVYIPEFSYKLKPGTSERSFDIQLTNEEYTDFQKHPAFSWLTKEINGFWFGKYETSGTSEKALVLPNQEPIKNTSLTSMYQAVQELNSIKRKDAYNQSLSEIHLIKNTEWGAVAILSQSKYGRCPQDTCSKIAKNEVWNTGSADKKSPYDTEKGIMASTTGNIYGIYDMVGGAWEFTMGTNDVRSLKVDIKEEYYNEYTNKGIVGDLTTEDGTMGWYGSTSNFLQKSQNWFIRGGDVNTENASLFWYNYDGPSGGFRNGFRLAYVMLP